MDKDITKTSNVFLNCFVWSMTLTTSEQNFHLFKVNNSNIVNVHFSLKTIEHMSCILLPNCLRFRNALETSTSGNCPISKEVCLKFRFCNIFLYLKKVCLRFSKKSFRFGFITTTTKNRSIKNKKLKKKFYRNRVHPFVLHCLIFT